MSGQAALFLSQLLDNHGHTPYSAATEAGLSSQTIRNWLAGSTPSLPAARKVAKLFHPDDGAELLEAWGFEGTAEHMRSTHDPNVANGWRLDTLIAETRELRKELRQQHAERLNAAQERAHTTAHFSVTDLRLLAAYIRGDDDDPPEGDMEPVND